MSPTKAALATLLILLAHGLAPGSEPDTVCVVFSYSDGAARSVCVAGDFNGWDARGHCMARHGDLWRLETSLPRGRHAYLYVVDGRDWVADPGATLFQESGFGARNSILVAE
jgi:1,4-alpha-glucan branching enzyme